LTTGSPIPLWHLEALYSPRRVQSINGQHLELVGGRRIRLPNISRIAVEQPLFQAALIDGVEVRTDGEVFGLMWADRHCGNDPYVWRRIRINLSDLSGALDPSGIDPAIASPEVVEFLNESGRIDVSYPNRSHDKGRVNIWDCIRMGQVRRVVNAALEKRGLPEQSTD